MIAPLRNSFSFVCFVLLASTSSPATAATVPNLRYLPGYFPPPSSVPPTFFNTVEITTSGNGVVLQPLQSGVVVIGGSGTPDLTEPETLPTVVIAPSAAIEFGSGTLLSNVTNHGSFTPGTFSSAGDLMISGDLNHETEGYLYIEVGGTDIRDNDFLRVFGSFLLKGKVRMIFTRGYAPSAGDVVPLASVSQAFSVDSLFTEKFEFANIAEPPSYGLSVSNNVIGLQFYNDTTFVPEPTALIMASYTVFLCGCRRRWL